MLDMLRLEHVGPAPKLSVTFRERLNFFAGDNGLGKTFLLDAAWYAMTNTWAGEPVLPHGPPAPPAIGWRLREPSGALRQDVSTFDRRTEEWDPHAFHTSLGLVLYARVDGGFGVWDHTRNARGREPFELLPAFTFTASEVWEGNARCEGLIRDWASWQLEGGEAFRQLSSVLKALSPSRSELLEPGDLRKISLSDPRRHPTLRMPYGEQVALVHASAGMRRVVALAYLLVWAWREHLEACQLLGEEPANEIAFLVDEVEAHLHPQWQRRIVPALLDVVGVLTGTSHVNVQLITATHSPLVLASVEPTFDCERDAVFVLELAEDRTVVLDEFPWSKQGDVVNWLVSEAFGLRQGRSLDAETAIEVAEAWMRGDRVPPELGTAEAIDAELKRVLAGHDPFWPRWVVWVERSAGANG